MDAPVYTYNRTRHKIFSDLPFWSLNDGLVNWNKILVNQVLVTIFSFLEVPKLLPIFSLNKHTSSSQLLLRWGSFNVNVLESTVQSCHFHSSHLLTPGCFWPCLLLSMKEKSLLLHPWDTCCSYDHSVLPITTVPLPAPVAIASFLLFATSFQISLSLLSFKLIFILQPKINQSFLLSTSPFLSLLFKFPFLSFNNNSTLLWIVYLICYTLSFSFPSGC